MGAGLERLAPIGSGERGRGGSGGERSSSRLRVPLAPYCTMRAVRM